MTHQLISELPVTPLRLDSMTKLFDAHKMLYDFGYRGALSTTRSEDSEGAVAESGRLDMVMEDNVAVSAALGDVILYRTEPTPQVVACMSSDAFGAGYEVL